ncbi:MAG: hypothetical protein RMM06_09500 [Armatimonadota bacterium]|nr:hypothetical protein [bacterium]MDW8290948.1 hypothetical protein [Armatimonadota bacterium]
MEKPASPTISFFRALRYAIGDAYDRLGLTLASSLLWFIACIPWVAALEMMRARFGLVQLGVVFLTSALLAQVWAGCVYLAYRIATRDEPSLICFVEAWRGMFWKTLALSLIQTFVTLVITFNMILYLMSNVLLLRVFGVVVLYLLLLWFTAMLYQYPLLVEHLFGAYVAEQTRASWLRRVLRRSLLLTIGNLPFSAGMFAIVAVWVLLCFLTLFGLVLLYAGVTALAAVHWTRALLINYGVIQLPPEPEIIPDEEFRIPEE